MAQYIDKDALVAEIEKCINKCNEKKHSCPVNTQVEAICDNKINAYNEIISLLNTLEVKEVDLEKEIDDWYNTMGIPVSTDALKETARHFFELGLKINQKGE